MAREMIDIDDELLDIVMQRYGVQTKTEAVDLALRRLAGIQFTTDEALGLRGAGLLAELPADHTL